MKRISRFSSWYYIFRISVAAIGLSACSGDDEGGVIGTGEKPALVKGTAQKGPFVKDSEVIINPLSTTAERTNSTINTKTVDDLGSFNFIASNNRMYDIAISGIHFNELTGSLSTQPISLHAFYIKQPASTNQVYVNVLTHLINQRIIYLIQNGDTSTVALDKAQKELLFFIRDAIFIIDLQNISFSNLSVYNIENTNELGNALLLYVTATLYQTATSRANQNHSDVDLELSDLLETVASDLRTDGKLTDFAFINEIRNATYLLNPQLIENNLTVYSEQVLGQALSVPDMNSVLDTDHDGIVNNLDLDDDGDGIPDTEDNFPYRFEILLEQDVFVSVNAGSEAIILYNANVPEFRYATQVISEAPQHGTLSYPGGATRIYDLLYTPDSGYSGPDQFSYYIVAYDGVTGVDYTSDTAVVKIEILTSP